MRPPVDHIAAPPFPLKLRWINSKPLRMDQQLGRPVLIEFWDFCRPNSIRTLPYVKAWHERYGEAGLRVIGVHTSGFEPSNDPDAVAAAVARLAIPYPVVVDAELRDLAAVRQPRLAGPVPVQRARAARRLSLRRGRLRRHRVGDPGAARPIGRPARPAEPAPARGRARRHSRAPVRGPARAAVRRPVRGRRRVGGARRRRVGGRQRRRARGRPPRRLPADRARARGGGLAEAAPRRRSELLQRLLHPGPRVRTDPPPIDKLRRSI